VGTAGFAGATGLAAGGVAGASAAGFAGVGAGAEAGFSAGFLASACTEADGVAFTAGTAGLSADGFASPSGGGGGGDLISSGIAANAQTSGSGAHGENVHFYQLEVAVSTRLAAVWRIHSQQSGKCPNAPDGLHFSSPSSQRHRKRVVL